MNDRSVKQLLENCPISYTALSQTLGVHRNTITNWRKEKTSPSVEQYLYIKSLFETTANH